MAANVGPADIAAIVAANIRAERARKGIGQADLTEAMRDLGYTAWHPQTVSRVERGDRRVQAEELLGLATCLGCHVLRFFDGMVQ